MYWRNIKSYIINEFVSKLNLTCHFVVCKKYYILMREHVKFIFHFKYVVSCLYETFIWPHNPLKESFKVSVSVNDVSGYSSKDSLHTFNQVHWVKNYVIEQTISRELEAMGLVEHIFCKSTTHFESKPLCQGTNK